MNVIVALLREGISVLRDAKGTAEQRKTLGLERTQFVNCMLFGCVVTLLSIVVPELSGMSAAMDRAMGDEPSDVMLKWPMLPTVAAALAALTALAIWKGPFLTDWLARRFGGRSSLMSAAIWLYLATAAGIVISLAIAIFDLAAGLASNVLPASIGYLSLAISLATIIVTLAISAVLAQHLLGLVGRMRSLLFTTTWLVGCFVIALAVWAPLYALLGGALT